MSDRFQWGRVETAFRELYATPHGDELRWLVNHETVTDAVTGRSMTRAIIRHPGIVVIVPFLDEDRIVLLRQYRYPLDGELWELPAGTIAGRLAETRVVPIETPEACAARELLEETGYEAARWEKVARCYAMPGGSDQLIHVFVARGLVRRAPSPDPGEVITEVRALSCGEVQRMIASGAICDAKTLVGLLQTLGRRAGGLSLS